MVRILGGITAVVVVLWASVASAATYQFTSDPYSTFVPSSPNPFVSGMRIAGTVVTSAPIGPNLVMQDVSGLITSYSFTDGVHTFTHVNSIINSPLNGGGFLVSTDASSNVTYVQVVIMSPLTPHTVGGLLNYIALGDGQGGYDSMTCAALQGSVCSQVSFGASAARAFALNMAVVLVPGVPVMPVWGVVALTIAIAWLGARTLRRRFPTAPHGVA